MRSASSQNFSGAFVPLSGHPDVFVHGPVAYDGRLSFSSFIFLFFFAIGHPDFVKIANLKPQFFTFSSGRFTSKVDSVVHAYSSS